MDTQRNMAVTLGERDVKTDVKAKNKYVYPVNTSVQLYSRTFIFRRDRRGAAIMMEGETADADAYMVQVDEMLICAS